MDNIFFNDTLVDIVESKIKKCVMQWSAEQHRIYCFGHIINLTTATFIYQKISDENLPAKDNDDEWHWFGYLKKLHNIIVYTQHSLQCCEKFKDFVENFNLH